MQSPPIRILTNGPSKIVTAIQLLHLIIPLDMVRASWEIVIRNYVLFLCGPIEILCLVLVLFGKLHIMVANLA